MPLRASSVAPRAPSSARARRSTPVSRARRRAARPVAANDDALGAFLPRRRPRRRADDDATRADDDARRRRATDDDATTSTSTPVAASTFARAYDDDDAPRDARRETRRRERDAYVARKRAREARKRACECVVVVEGGADVRAVRNEAGFTSERAKVVAVRHRGAFRRRPRGEMEVKRERMDEIEALSVKYDAPIVVLFDCDTAGRQLRNAFLRRFPDATHAFMGARVSSAKEDGKWHARGNVGVEHGEGEDIARAIARARRADRDRAVFTREALAEWGLVADDAVADVWADFGGVAQRRRLVGEYLGVGDCDGRQLLRQLNLFFTEDEFREAVDALPKRGEPVPPKMTDGRADRARPREADLDDFALLGFDPTAYVPPGRAPRGFE